MSRLANKPIALPAGTTVTADGSSVVVKGKKGEIPLHIPADIEVTVVDQTAVVKKREGAEHHAAWGLVWAMVRNAVHGVSEGWNRILEFTGVGYTAQVAGSTLKMTLGFSHPVEVAIPKGLTVTVDKSAITIAGIDKELIGQFAANVRSIRPPEPYKGKGIRYNNEVIERKEGKKAGTTTA